MSNASICATARGRSLSGRSPFVRKKEPTITDIASLFHAELRRHNGTVERLIAEAARGGALEFYGTSWIWAELLREHLTAEMYDCIRRAHDTSTRVAQHRKEFENLLTPATPILRGGS